MYVYVPPSFRSFGKCDLTCYFMSSKSYSRTSALKRNARLWQVKIAEVLFWKSLSKFFCLFHYSFCTEGNASFEKFYIFLRLSVKYVYVLYLFGNCEHLKVVRKATEIRQK